MGTNGRAGALSRWEGANRGRLSLPLHAGANGRMDASGWATCEWAEADGNAQMGDGTTALGHRLFTGASGQVDVSDTHSHLAPALTLTHHHMSA